MSADVFTYWSGSESKAQSDAVVALARGNRIVIIDSMLDDVLASLTIEDAELLHQALGRAINRARSFEPESFATKPPSMHLPPSTDKLTAETIEALQGKMRQSVIIPASRVTSSHSNHAHVRAIDVDESATLKKLQERQARDAEMLRKLDEIIERGRKRR